MHQFALLKLGLTLFGKRFALASLLLVPVIGLIGVALALAIGAPLPWLFGSVVAVGTASILRLGGRVAPMQFPMQPRDVFVPVIGVAIGGSFTPALVGEVWVWAPSLLALLIYIPVIHLAGFWLCRRIGRVDPVTAWFSTMPGGFIEAIVMGEARGANVALLTAVQFLRLVLCILLVPLGFSIIEGEAVGSASGVELPGADIPLTFWEGAVLTACGALGYFLAKWIKMPAGIIAGPLLLSGAAHLVGLVEGQPPDWLIRLTQFVIGLTLGVRFAGIDRAALLRALEVALVIVLGTLGLAALAGWLLGDLVEESTAAVVLAFAPGGLVEMSLVALSLGLSTIYVTAHHVLRILLAVAFGRLAFGWALGHGASQSRDMAGATLPRDGAKGERRKQPDP
ncbi:MAG: AbrB family transcriptional regulator [Pseudomonadota bacterium]